MSNSLTQVLAQMRAGSVTRGWGAVSVQSRSRLNQLLTQQYIQRFDTGTFLPLFSGVVETEDAYGSTVQLQGLALGQPLLQFNTASMTDSRAVISMNITGGHYLEKRGNGEMVSAFSLSEGHGFQVEIDLDLTLVVGEVDRHGIVTLDLSKASSYRCNLANSNAQVTAAVQAFFQESFDQMPADRRIFQLGSLDLKGYNLLNPRSFRIYTQAAPGAKVRGAKNYGDGAVVAFIRVMGNAAEGQAPGSQFPYLIPDDQDAQGQDQYSAVLVIAESMLRYLSGDREEVFDALNSLLYPGDNAFVKVVEHTPRDLAVFGKVDPLRTQFRLEPQFATLQAGEQQPFTVRNGHGDTVSAVSWEALGMQSTTDNSQGTMSSAGVYTAAERNQLGRDCLHVKVTAKVTEGPDTYIATALLLVNRDPLWVAPHLSVIPAARGSSLLAAAGQTGVPTWQLVGTRHGTFSTETGSQTAFTSSASRAKALVVQGVQAQLGSGITAQGAVVLVNGKTTLGIEPAYVPRLQAGQTRQLVDNRQLLPELPRRWKVLSGSAMVSDSGLLTVPSQASQSTSVVLCEIVRNGVVLSTGYSVVDVRDEEDEPHWRSLTEFNVRVIGQGQGREGSLYANGYQQLLTEVRVLPQAVDGQKTYLSPYERNSIQLVFDRDGQNVEAVPEGLEGIAPDADVAPWQARLLRNRFEMAPPKPTRDSAPTNDAVTLKDIYLHSRGDRPTTFYVKLNRQADNAEFRSTDNNNSQGRIDVDPVAVPIFNNGHYTFSRKRIGPGNDREDDDENNFDLKPQTLDYWSLSYVNGAFVSCEFLVYGQQIEVPTSIVRWESEQLAETMFSCTGWMFKPHGTGQVPIIEDVEKDFRLQEIVTSMMNADPLDNFVEPGALVVVLERSSTVGYVRATHPARQKMDHHLLVRLLDQQGNPHVRKIQYLPAGQNNHRDKLLHSRG